MTCSTRMLRRYSIFSTPPAEPITVAPRSRAIWQAMEPHRSRRRRYEDHVSFFQEDDIRQVNVSRMTRVPAHAPGTSPGRRQVQEAGVAPAARRRIPHASPASTGRYPRYETRDHLTQGPRLQLRLPTLVLSGRVALVITHSPTHIRIDRHP